MVMTVASSVYHRPTPTSGATSFERNQARDRRVYKQLHDLGYYVLVVWECQLAPARRQATLQALSARLAEIYLDTHQAKPRPYGDYEESLPAIAAET